MSTSVRFFVLAAGIFLVWLGAGFARADTVIYSNDFEAGIVGTTGGGATTTGFSVGSTGMLATKTLTTSNLLGTATPDFGPGNSTNWLAMYESGTSGGVVGLGYQVAKSSKPESVNLVLSNLTAGATYSIAFDLVIRRSWDGAAAGYGSDGWYFSVDGSRLVDTLFSNVSNTATPNPNGGTFPADAGAYSPQRYSDTFYTSPGTASNDVPRFTGADVIDWDHPSGSVYNSYAIYYFGHGSGNPQLQFTATAATATFEWARYNPVGTEGAGSDENWSLDNVTVTTSGDPASVPLPGVLPAGLLCIGGLLLRRRPGAQS